MNRARSARGSVSTRARALAIAVAVGLTAAGLPAAPARAEQLSPAMEHARAVNAAKLVVTQAGTPSGKYPFYTDTSGQWGLSAPRRWVSGMLPGMLWLEYQRTGAAGWRSAAESRGVAIRPYATDTRFHDIGFMFLGSDRHDWRLTGDAAARDRLLTAARSLDSRYDSRVGMVRTLDTTPGFWVYNDTMMNVELLFWGASHGGGSGMRGRALSHSLRTIADFLRPDGSSYHYVVYNERTGAIVDKGQGQGYADESTWSRGQAWIVYGLAVAFRETGDRRLADGAWKASRYWIDHVPSDLVPYWDFNAPGIPNEPRDSSAAAIAASAFIELGRLDPDPARRTVYLDVARRTLESLSSPAYLSEAGDGFAAVLEHGTHAKMLGAYDHGTSWGDYYFAEALARLRTQVQRLAGPDRYATAVRASQVNFASAGSAIVASGELYPDALSASALAGVLDGPVLLTRRDRLPDNVAAEIRRLGAARVIIVGGTQSVGGSVAAALDALPGVSVERIAGPDRYATAAMIAARVAKELGAAYGGEVFLVRGDEFADGLSVSPIAYRNRMPVLLTRQTALSDAAASFLASSETTRVVVAGGENAVSGAVEASLRTRFGCATRRLAGANRYATAAAAAAWAIEERRARAEFTAVATGMAWPDALAGGPAAGEHGGLLLLTRQAHLAGDADTFLRQRATAASVVHVLGGESAVSAVAENELRTALPEQ